MYEITFFSYKNIHIFKQIFKNSISNVAKSVFYQGISVQIPQPTLNNTQKLQYIIAVMYNSFSMEVFINNISFRIYADWGSSWSP